MSGALCRRQQAGASTMRLLCGLPATSPGDFCAGMKLLSPPKKKIHFPSNCLYAPWAQRGKTRRLQRDAHGFWWVLVWWWWGSQGWFFSFFLSFLKNEDGDEGDVLDLTAGWREAEPCTVTDGRWEAGGDLLLDVIDGAAFFSSGLIVQYNTAAAWQGRCWLLIWRQRVFERGW